MVSLVKSSMFQSVWLGAAILLYGLHTSNSLETFKQPQLSNLQIEASKWQELHFGIILPANDRRSLELRVHYRDRCLAPQNYENIRIWQEPVTYCPTSVLDANRAQEVKCKGIVVFIKGNYRFWNNQTISLCYFPHSTTEVTHLMELNYTVYVNDSTYRTPTTSEVPTTRTVETFAEIRDQIKRMSEKYEITMFAVQMVTILICFLITWMCIVKQKSKCNMSQPQREIQQEQHLYDNFSLQKREERQPEVYGGDVTFESTYSRSHGTNEAQRVQLAELAQLEHSRPASLGRNESHTYP